MPQAAMVSKSNDQLAAQSLPKILREFPKEVERLGNPGTLVQVARTVIGLTDEEAEYLEAIPTALQEMLRVAIYTALSHEKSVQIQYSPAYDFSVKAWDYGQAVSIHVSGPYEAGNYSNHPEHYAAAKRAKVVRKGVKRKPTARKTTAKRKPAKKSASRARKRGR